MSSTPSAPHRLLVLSFSVALAACGGMSGLMGDGGADARNDAADEAFDVDDQRVVDLRITPVRGQVFVGRTVAMTAMAARANGSTVDATRMVTWSVSDPTAASIDTDGVLFGIAMGSARVNALLGDLNASPAVVEVITDHLASVTLEPARLDLSCGDALPHAITARGAFTDGTSRAINDAYPGVWTSSSPMVATVDASGRVTAVGAGATSITARFFDVTSSAVAVTVTACRGM